MNQHTETRKTQLKIAILSLSLLTVMAGAAVAPALHLIRTWFAEADTGMVQMIISLPALFIALTNFIFPALCQRLKARTLVMIGLFLYTVGGCMAGAFSHLMPILIFRALVGVGVGIIMPLSTGLIAYYFSREEQVSLMGLSSAMNMLGGVVATLIAGFLAMVSWRLAFLVYLMGLISILLCLFWMPNESIAAPPSPKKEEATESSPTDTSFVRRYSPFILGIFLLMFTFFIYPASFAMETVKSGVFSQAMVGPIMAMMDLLGFFGGILFAPLRHYLRHWVRFAAPVLFFLAYGCLGILGGAAGILLGSALVGFANGVGVPYFMSTASMKAGKHATTTIMPWLSAALYFSQFFTPMILTLVRTLLHQPELSGYPVAMVSAILLGLCAWRAR